MFREEDVIDTRIVRLKLSLATFGISKPREHLVRKRGQPLVPKHNERKVLYFRRNFGRFNLVQVQIV